MSMRIDREPSYYLSLFNGARIERQRAESSHPTARVEIERLLELGRIVEEVQQEKPTKVSTIYFNKPVDQIGRVPATVRILR